LEKAKSGKISSAEIQAVAQELGDPLSEVDRYTLLHILGKAEAKSFADVVERYVDYQDDPMVARLALQVLCTYWGYGSRYLRHLIAFVRGVPWDTEDEVRLAATSIAGEFLRSTREPELLKALIEVYEDEGANQTARETAYLALGRAMGLGWDELPPASRHFDLATQTKPSVIETAKRYAEAES
jgi:hypothetical protein